MGGMEANNSGQQTEQGETQMLAELGKLRQQLEVMRFQDKKVVVNLPKQKKALLADFAERKQGAREGIREYSNDLFSRHEKLTQKQKKEGKQVVEEDALVGQFVEGLCDKSLALDLKRQTKKSNLSFAEARCEALE
ncbi:hypothetical protein ACOMHN_061675 [Nucella lapillus]